MDSNVAAAIRKRLFLRGARLWKTTLKRQHRQRKISFKAFEIGINNKVYVMYVFSSSRLKGSLVRLIRCRKGADVRRRWRPEMESHYVKSVTRSGRNQKNLVTGDSIHMYLIITTCLCV